MFGELKIGDRTLLSQCRIATDFASRLLGLMFRKKIGEDEGVLFPRCNSIHTFFMRVPIDVLFLDAHGKILEIVEKFPPWRMTLPRKGARFVLELRAGRAHELSLAIGNTLTCGECLP